MQKIVTVFILLRRPIGREKSRSNKETFGRHRRRLFLSRPFHHLIWRDKNGEHTVTVPVNDYNRVLD